MVLFGEVVDTHVLYDPPVNHLVRRCSRDDMRRVMMACNTCVRDDVLIQGMNSISDYELERHTIEMTRAMGVPHPNVRGPPALGVLMLPFAVGDSLWEAAHAWSVNNNYIIVAVEMHAYGISMRATGFENCRLPIITVLNTHTLDRVNNATFRGCKYLCDIDLSACTRVANNAFKNCISLQRIRLPVCTVLQHGAFEGCTALVSADLPALVDEIPNNAFMGCTDLITISLPDRPISLGVTAFRNCYRLQTPPPCLEHVTEIMAGCFDSCHSLGSVLLPNLDTLGSGVFKNSGVSHVWLPDNIVNVPDHTFDGCGALTHLHISPFLTRIGAKAFANCVNLTLPYGYRQPLME
jgi:hypothetical protein